MSTDGNVFFFYGYPSEWVNVRPRVPQGLILGPLLFLLFGNDIGSRVRSSVKLFADDCTIYDEIRSKADCEVLQKDLNAIYCWSQKWQLNLNLSKCKMMSISNKRKPIEFRYLLNDSFLEEVDTFRYLGIQISSKLSWKGQIADASARATRILNLLKRSMYGCTKQAKARAYTALVRPHLEFCAPVWTLHGISDQNNFDKVQKSAARWICARRDCSCFQWSKSYDICRAELGWLTILDHHRLLSCSWVYKMIHKLDCLKFEDYFIFNNSSTRSHGFCIRISSSRINAFRYSFFINVPSLWNTFKSCSE